MRRVGKQLPPFGLTTGLSVLPGSNNIAKREATNHVDSFGEAEDSDFPLFPCQHTSRPIRMD
jgi:hypothetical protein